MRGPQVLMASCAAAAFTWACGSTPTVPTKTPAVPALSVETPRAQSRQPISMGGFGVCALLGPHGVDCWRLLPGRAPEASSYEIEEASQVGVGRAHACALHGGRVSCFGSNRHGELGVAGIAESARPVLVRGLPPVVQIAVGAHHGCALDEDSHVWCWGAYDSKPHANAEPASPRLIADVAATSLLARERITCALLENGHAHCWGLDEVVPDHAFEDGDGARHWIGPEGLCSLGAGRAKCSPLFTGRATTSLQAGTAQGGERVRQVVAGRRHACLLSEEGSVSCRGENSWAQLAHPPTELTRSAPGTWVPVELAKVMAISAHGDVTCALLTRDEVACWGALSPEFRTNYPKPVKVEGLANVDALAVGADQACAGVAGRWYCWGRALAEGVAEGVSAAGEFAPPTAHRYAPRLEPALDGLSALVLGGGYACGSGSQGVVCAWPARHEQPNSSPFDPDVPLDLHLAQPRQPGSVAHAAVLAAGRRVACARDPRGTVSCFGRGAGDEESAEKVFSLRGPRRSFSELVVSDATVCGLADQAVHCAPLESGKSFERIQALNGAARIALSDSWLCSIDVRGQVACTKPANQAGKPVPLAGSVPFVDLALSGERICVLDQQGAVRCAYASDPNLGSPMLGDVARIGGGNCHFSALTLKGEVYSWGCNHAGQAGASVRPFSVVPTPLQRGKASG